MRYLVLIIAFFLSCKPAVVTENLLLTIHNQDGDPISGAEVLIDEKLFGKSDLLGRWSGNIQLPSQTKHKLTIKAKPPGIEFATWERYFQSDGATLNLTVKLDSVNKPGQDYGRLDVRGLPVEKIVEPQSPVQAISKDKNDKNSFASLVALWRSSYSRDVGSLPPMMPVLTAIPKGDKQQPKPVSLETITPNSITPTIYVRSGPIGISGAEIWIAKPELKSICVTNMKGRCSPEVPVDIGSVLIRKKGFRSVSLSIRGEGTYQVPIDSGLSQDIFIKSGDLPWIVRQSGLEITRGEGDSFVVIDRLYQDVSVDGLGARSSVSKIVGYSDEVVEVDMGSSRNDGYLYVEDFGFIGDYEGELTPSFKQLSRELDLVLEKMGIKRVSVRDSAQRFLQLNLVRSGDDQLVEAKIFGSEDNRISFGLSGCVGGYKNCLRKSIEKAIRPQFESSPEARSSNYAKQLSGVIGLTAEKHGSLVGANSGGNSKSEKITSNGFEQADLEFTLRGSNQETIGGARIYLDGAFTGFSNDDSRFLIPALTGNTIEIVKEGQNLYRGYWTASEKSKAITLLPGSVLISGETESGVGVLKSGEKVIGQFPGLVAVKPSNLLIDGGSQFKTIPLQVGPGQKIDLGIIRFHKDLMSGWNQKLLEGDFLGAEKIMKSAEYDHPDYVSFAYLLREKDWVETGRFSEEKESDNLKSYLTYRLLFAKSKGLEILQSGNLDDLRKLQVSISDILPLATTGSQADLIYEVHFLKSLADLRIASALKDPELLKASITKVHQWLESDLAGRLPLDGKKMWDMARNDLINQKRKVL